MSLDYHLLGGRFWVLAMVSIATLGTRMANSIQKHRRVKDGSLDCEPVMFVGE